MKHFFLFLFTLTTFNCNKGDDFKGEEVLRGRLSYIDQYTGGNTPIALAGKIVKLAYSPSDTLNFIYSTRTDSAGYFSFIKVDKDKAYDLFFQDSIGGSLYTAFVTKTPPNDTVTLLATNDMTIQNGIHIQIVDGNNQKLGPVKVCIFNNQTLAHADTCDGSIMQLNTDPDGRAVTYNLSPGTYYLRARMKVGNIVFSGDSSLIVTLTGINLINFTLRQEATHSNGFELRIRDIYGTPVASANTCIFNSRVLFLGDSCSGNIKTITSNINGIATWYDITPGKYYLKTYASFGNISLAGMDSVIVPAAGVAIQSITLEQ